MSTAATRNRIHPEKLRVRVIRWDRARALMLWRALPARVAGGALKRLAAVFQAFRWFSRRVARDALPEGLRVPAHPAAGGALPFRARTKRAAHVCCKLNKAPPALA